MFLQPPEELAGPTWSESIPPSFRPAAQPRSTPDNPADEPPGFLLQARAALQQHPESALAFARLAQAAQSTGDSDEALGAAKQALQLGIAGSDRGAVHAALAVLTGDGPHEEIAALIDDPHADRMPVSIRVRAAAAVGEFDAAQRLPGLEISSDALAVVAWIRLEQRDFRGSVAAGRQAEQMGGGGVSLYTNLGYAHAALGNLTKAIKHTRQALALSPTDRRIGLNLVHYLRLAGRTESALHQLESMRFDQRLDTELALATARALGEAGRAADAHRVLQRARASREWAVADDVSRAELTANLALLRWITRRDKADSSLQEILRALQSCDYKSVSVAYLLMNLMRTPAHAERLARIIGRLESKHDEEELLGLRMLLAVLSRDTDGAIRYARAWAAHDLFNPFAAATAAVVVGEMGGDFQAAAEIGLGTLRRAPNDVMLINNTAFSLAMAGHLDHARKLLVAVPRMSNASVHITATRALLDLLGGHTDKGFAGYRLARRMAEEQGDSALAARVGIYAALAERASGGTQTLDDLEQIMEDEIPPGSRDLPEFWITKERLKRERKEHADRSQSPGLSARPRP